MSAPLPDRAAAVVIGGGVLGVSVAHHLAAGGLSDVVVLEAAELGAGSSAKPLGGVRATFSDPANVELAAWSLRRYLDFGAEVACDIGLHRVGYLFLVRDDADLPVCEDAVAVQNAFGAGARVIGPQEAAALCPPVDPAALVAASWSPRDGFAQPARVVDGYAAAATRAGATICTRTAATGIELTGGRVAGVQVGDRLVATDTVICCAGAWSARVGDWVGVDLPVTPVKRQIAITPPRRGGWPRVPFTLDLATTMYFHNASFGARTAAADDGLLVGISDPDTPDGFDREPSEEWLPGFRAAARVCAPGLADLPTTGGWAGLYENTPDHNALIGASDRVPGFLYATGFSGHGFLQAPGAGRIVADLVLGRRPFMDPAPFSAERFARRAERPRELHII